MPTTPDPQYERNNWQPIPDPTKLTTDAVRTLEVHIRELYDLRFQQLDLRLEQRFQAQSKALDAALLSADLKSNALSEKINDLGLDLKAYVPRTEYSARDQSVTDRLEELRVRQYESAGRSHGVQQLWGFIIGAFGLVGVIVTIMAFVLK